MQLLNLSVNGHTAYLLGSQLTVITDQQSVAFMFGKLNHGKMKKDKITRWRIEQSSYGFCIIHRPGKDKLQLPADALPLMTSPSYCSAIADLKSLHNQLCDRGISPLVHFYTMEDIKSIIKSRSLGIVLKWSQTTSNHRSNLTSSK